MNYLEYLATKTFLLNELEKLENRMKKTRRAIDFYYIMYSQFFVLHRRTDKHMKRADYIAIKAFLDKELEVLEKDMKELNLKIDTVNTMIGNLEKENSSVLNEGFHIKTLGKSNKEDIKKQLNEKYGIAYINKNDCVTSIMPDVTATDNLAKGTVDVKSNNLEKGTVSSKTNDKKLDGKTIDYFTIDDLL
jgi:hypothetical protein